MTRLVIIILLVALVCAAPAGAAPIDVTSDHVALLAYDRYVSGVASDVPAWHRADDAFTDGVSSTCPNVLAADNLLPLSSVNASALTAFTEEVGVDVAVVSNAPELRPLAKLARSLSRLRWSSHQTAITIKRFLTASRTFLSLTPSNLCADAQALAASGVQVTPPGTLPWLAKVGRSHAVQQKRLSGFIRILQRFQAQTDGPVIDAINRLVKRVQKAGGALLSAEAPKLLAALGLVG